MESIQWHPQVPTGLELRAADDGGPGVIAGPLLLYSDTARVWGVEERIAPGAFGDLSGADVIARYMHDRAAPLARTGVAGAEGRLSVRDSADGLHVEIGLLDTQRGRDAASEVRAGVLRGLSVEFVPMEWDAERAGDGKLSRVVHTRARLVGLGVVDIPAYPRSVPSVRYELLGQAMQRRRAWL